MRLWETVLLASIDGINVLGEEIPKPPGCWVLEPKCILLRLETEHPGNPRLLDR